MQRHKVKIDKHVFYFRHVKFMGFCDVSVS